MHDATLVLAPDSTTTARQRRGRWCIGPGRSGACKSLLPRLGRPRACQIDLGFIISIALYPARPVEARGRFWSAMFGVCFGFVKMVLGPVDTVLHTGTSTAPEEHQQEQTSQITAAFWYMHALSSPVPRPCQASTSRPAVSHTLS